MKPDHVRGLDSLTVRQKQCLRLYHQRYQAKEIATKLGLSYNTVNEHLRDARVILGVTSSSTAARLLHEHERDNRLVPNAFGVQPPRIFEESRAAVELAEPVLIVRNRYNLTGLARIGMILAIAFVAVALVGASIVGTQAITRLFQEHRIDISDPPYRQ